MKQEQQSDSRGRADEIAAYLTPGRRVHLVGIGGVSMAPLAEVLAGKGLVVSGSDQQESPAVERLRRLGIPVAIGHRRENVEKAEFLICTAAVHENNPEVAAAMELQLPIFQRAEAWGSLMRRYQNALCIAGTHGKTTATSMCAHIAMAEGADPTVMIGGTLPLLGTGHRVGKGKTIILESCEYCNSFLSFYPTVAVILNVEEDHLDFFSDLEDIEHSFRAFADLVPETGVVLANGEDANTMEALRGKKGVMTFGLAAGDVHAAGLRYENGCGIFSLSYRGEAVCEIRLQVPGEHNVKNALAAAGACLVLGMSPQAVAQGLADFRGAGRRFEYKGTVRGARVYDDYAHHPGELKALLSMTAQLGYERVICAFQPHTYSRTKALFHQFAAVLAQADCVLLAEIYAAREENIYGVSSAQLAESIPGARVCPTLADVTQTLYEMARPGDLILTVGAGDIVKAGEELVRRGETP